MQQKSKQDETAYLVDESRNVDPDCKFPKIIWMYWHQGLDNAPNVVRACVASWKQHNPDWELNLIDHKNIENYVSLKLNKKILSNIGITEQSNLLRIQLLEEYGGVWADATTFCTTSLNSWIYKNMRSGFFCFSNPGRDRIMSNWFMAAEMNHIIMTEMLNKYIKFFTNSRINNSGRLKKTLVRYLSKVLNKTHKTTKYWLSPVITKFIGVHPYFIFHYMFEDLTRNIPDIMDAWSRTPKISANEPHMVARMGLLNEITIEQMTAINDSNCPVFKLSWHYDHTMNTKSTVISYLLRDYEAFNIDISSLNKVSASIPDGN